MDIILLSIVLFLFCVLLGIIFYIYSVIQDNYAYTDRLTRLVTRTFREYYKGEDIEPEVLGNSIDLVWKGEVSGFFNEENKTGFITIFTKDSGINSPINDIEEADILAKKITDVVYEYIKDREQL